MTRFVELGGTRKPGRPRPHDSDALARAGGRRLRNDPSLFKALVDNGALDALDRDRGLVNPQDTRGFAGCRADPACKLGKIVRFVQTIEGFFPQPAVDEVVPVRDKVADGTARGHPFENDARVAEGNATVHAARPLCLQRVL